MIPKQKALFSDLPAFIDNALYEKRLFNAGIRHVAGVDEVGRGCLAGPVLAAAVVLPFPYKAEGITDSKRLTPKKREILHDRILKDAVAYAFGIVEADEIDEINILQATLKAMRLAVAALRIKPKYLLVDGSHVIPMNIPQLIIPKGDYRSVSVGAASIVAKVTRDRMMAELEKENPAFKFSLHKGYGTKLHYEELRRWGTTEMHRKSFLRGLRHFSSNVSQSAAA